MCKQTICSAASSFAEVINKFKSTDTTSSSSHVKSRILNRRSVSNNNNSNRNSWLMAPSTITSASISMSVSNVLSSLGLSLSRLTKDSKKVKQKKNKKNKKKNNDKDSSSDRNNDSSMSGSLAAATSNVKQKQQVVPIISLTSCVLVIYGSPVNYVSNNINNKKAPIVLTADDVENTPPITAATVMRQIFPTWYVNSTTTSMTTDTDTGTATHTTSNNPLYNSEKFPRSTRLNNFCLKY